MKKLPIIIIVFLIVLTSCNKKISVIAPKIDIDTVINIDYTNSYFQGFRIPNDTNKEISYTFSIDNKTGEKLFYKIYFQNESYKFNEIVNSRKRKRNSVKLYNKLAAENFYGSFKNPHIGFLSVENPIVKGSFVIEGNPRDEERYYGNQHTNYCGFNEKLVEKYIAIIKSDKKWYKDVKKKAKSNNIKVEAQIEKDAKWIIENEIQKNHINNKWKRNLRLGNYSFLLVVTTKSDLEKIPEYIKDITIKGKKYFVNPYYYFLYGKGSKLKNTSITKIDKITRLKALPPIKNGIYVKYDKYAHPDTNNFNRLVGNRASLYREASFAYYENERVNNKIVHNIPVIADYFGEGYTKKQYKTNVEKYKDNKVDIYFTNSSAPGSTFGIDTTNGSLYFFNPPSTENNYRKENVGIKTRNGFTYGKYTLKIKMAELLNDDNVWTGLTNAIWLLSESLEPWNNRRKCWRKGRGYKPYYGAKKEELTVKQMPYTEIDFEIIKAAQFWPKTSYSDKKERLEPKSNDDKVMVACTNWDLSCWQPKNYGVGVNEIKYKSETFYNHRWDHWYSALTSKVPEKDDELFGRDYYYFQIEWKPDEIIWRIGPEKDQLRVVGYMNDKVTSIPNNQMTIIITQEYHQASWWPNAPFKQDNLPFNAKKLEGVLYELEIE